jgi:hypothetical protein
MTIAEQRAQLNADAQGHLMYSLTNMENCDYAAAQYEAQCAVAKINACLALLPQQTRNAAQVADISATVALLNGGNA